MKKEKSCGCIIYRYNKNVREFLLIHQKYGDYIGFPKGHIENDETEIETAYREVREETNLDVFIFSDIKAKDHYIIDNRIDKEVIYFLATPLSFEINKQDDEIQDLKWVKEDLVSTKLTYDHGKKVFDDIIDQFKKHIEYQLDLNLVSYLYETILPIYRKFDKAHQYDHVHQVVKTSLEIASTLKDIRLDLVYIIAFYHDIGNLYGRDMHHLTGAKYLEDDQMINSYYHPDEIKIMKEAIEDHRASHENEPRSIYGKIIAEADRDIIPLVIISRTVLFGLSHYPNITKDEHMIRAYEHLQEKYGQNGYLKLWLDSKKNVEGLSNLRQLIADRVKIMQIIDNNYEKYNKIDKKI
ncbi:MAG: NUDIX domain-containing protein [Acholeplasmataceae bacterium]|nr:NUDIX domain-containing protein [Acholeplasmataceae bacterium]